MNPLEIIYDHYQRGSRQADVLIGHSRQVRDNALEIAGRVADLNPDMDLIAEAAMLHDIGVCRTASPNIHCQGDQPYIRHGIIGRQMLENYGLTAHALICERHVGAGLSRQEIEQQQLPLPLRDMLPTTIEEIIICYADSFFSKTAVGTYHTLAEVMADHTRHGTSQVDRFNQWHVMLGG